MVDSRVRQIFFGRIVLQFLQIDIPSRFELAAAGARERERERERRMRLDCAFILLLTIVGGIQREFRTFH